MPFASERQRRWMHENLPDVAQRWEAEAKADGAPVIRKLDHVEKRRLERAPTVPRYVIDHLRRQAKTFDGPPGVYHYPIHHGGGLAGYGVFRKSPDSAKLILRTVYGRMDKPPGASLAEKFEPSPLMKAAQLLAKHAEITTPLQPHQQRAVERMQRPDQSGLVLNWGLGSGKSLGAISIADALGKPTDVVVPAALQENFRKEIAKHTKGRSFPADVKSLESVARGLKTLQRPVLVVDEAHRLRNPTKAQTEMVRSPAEKRVVLTGSLMYNHPADMAAPINLAAGAKVLPTSPSEFEQHFVRQERYEPGFLARTLLRRKPETRVSVNPETKAYLTNALRKYVDHYPGNASGMAEQRDETVNVPLTGEQLKLYNTLYGATPAWVRHAVKSDLSPNKRDLGKMMAFLTGPRQAAISNHSFLDNSENFQSNKVDAAMGRLQKMLAENPEAKAVIYSNFLGAGIEPYRKRLQAAGVPFGEFTGEQPAKTRDQMVRDYNEGKLKALLLSSAGGEGLDLQGTRLIQLMEPHWNDEKLKQVVGRGIRYKSHDHLPEDQRNVQVQRFVSTMPEQSTWDRVMGTPEQTVDEYMQNRAGEKERLNNVFRDLVRTSAR